VGGDEEEHGLRADGHTSWRSFTWLARYCVRRGNAEKPTPVLIVAVALAVAVAAPVSVAALVNGSDTLNLNDRPTTSR
jgi:hypothetical protein